MTIICKCLGINAMVISCEIIDWQILQAGMIAKVSRLILKQSFLT